MSLITLKDQYLDFRCHRMINIQVELNISLSAMVVASETLRKVMFLCPFYIDRNYGIELQAQLTF